jgi:hypothetical protein
MPVSYQGHTVPAPLKGSSTTHGTGA